MNFNIKGITIGNPLLDFDTDMNAVDEYYWSHGIITDYAYKIMTSLCNSSRVLREYFSGQISKDCVLLQLKKSQKCILLQLSLTHSMLLGRNVFLTMYLRQVFLGRC